VPVIASGGLTPDNVADAIRAMHPYAVDTASGTESAPGRKDPAKLEAFFAAADQGSSLSLPHRDPVRQRKT
jgi:phosphoribosylanthranilate isomerase